MLKMEEESGRDVLVLLSCSVLIWSSHAPTFSRRLYWRNTKDATTTTSVLAPWSATSSYYYSELLVEKMRVQPKEGANFCLLPEM